MTRNNYDQTFKETLVDLYQTGQCVLELSKEYGVMVHLKSMLNYLDKEKDAHSNEFRRWWES